MNILAVVAGIAIVLLVLWDTFETIVTPKTVERRFSLTTLFYNLSWRLWSLLSKAPSGGFRQAILVSYGPMSLIMLIAAWACLLIFGFALVDWGLGALSGPAHPSPSLGEDLYYSGVTFLTLGYGDMTPTTGLGRTLAVIEAGVGFAFLAVVISYVPVMYNAFSRREINITLLDSKAGSNPTGGELLRRHGEGQAMEALIVLLKEWERWSAEQLEAYLSYPVLAFYRSQHDDQSWLCSLTAILDACSLIMMGFEGDPAWAAPLKFQAKATFAMGRHVIVDLAYILAAPPRESPPDRLSPNDWLRLQEALRAAGIPLKTGPQADEALRRSRELYEPYVVSLAQDLLFTLPAWFPQPGAKDNWETTAWDDDRHFVGVGEGAGVNSKQ
jgi:hypothetical protein